MPLLDATLWGPRNKVDIAIERLQNLAPADGYYLSFSGGKDSVTLYRLAEMAEVKFDAHYNITTVDPPELVQFIKQEYPTVERHHPEKSMWALISDHQCPPSRQQRYCCQALKEGGGTGRVVLTGIRWAESNRRRKRHMTEACMTDGTKTFVNPIIDWTDADVWEFIRSYKVPYCLLYDEGFKRLGCVLCPMSRNSKRDIERWPKIAAQYVRTFDKLIIERTTKGKKTTFKTGQEWFDWWITREGKSTSEGQLVMFE